MFYKLGAVSSAIVFATLLTTGFSATPALGSSSGVNFQAQPAYPDGCDAKKAQDDNGKSVDASCRDRGYALFVRCTEEPGLKHRIELIAKDGTGRYAARFTCPGGPGNTVEMNGTDVNGAYTTGYYFERIS